MGHKHLHELLEEDQEPFLLNKYIADRRCQLNKPSVETHLQIKKRKPISQNSNLPSNFCKNACFFSRKSPLFESASPAKSPCRSPNAIFLHIPAKTAALLLEAALRIQKKSSPKTKHSTSFGFFGSILKRLTHRNRNRKRGIANDGAKVPVKDTLGWDPTVVKNNSSRTKMSSSASIPEDKSGYEMGFSCSYNGRPSSAVWSESNEEKSLDTSCSCSQSEYFEEILTSSRDILVNNSAFSSCDSPFHFMLQKSPSLGHRTPLFSSPGISPQKQDEANYEVESLKKLQVEEDDEEKEQCSPVSVMDPRFEDDDDDRHVNDCDDNDGFDLECSYAAVQRAKQQLLHKLRRFEKLAGFDPIELEKIMLEQDQDDDNGYNGVCIVEEEESGNESVSSDDEMNVDGFLQVLNSSFHNPRHVPAGMKRLVTELITEEETEQSGYVDRVAVIKRVCNRLESWKEVESNTIDMMVEQNLRKEPDCWKRHQVQMRETALEVEHTIFGLLTKELSEELVSLTGA
ncbi:putative transcription factor [Hibiscus syriacus]|uniref:Transcription factor n=2 Tax=Hibiscus syriacus TaxID=106335 RepID=A0A6A3CKN9_HIBSY|nr:putative transcription factor [Hibiscus syriacus]